MRSFVLTIDIEPVARMLEPGVPPSWAGLDCAVALVERLREHFDAHISWFARVDPQLAAACGREAWILEERAALFDALEAGGDAIGLHVHTYRWIPERRTWLNEHEDRSWIEECLERAAGAFAAARGKRAVLFRFGDRWLDDATVAHLERLGIEIDLTVESGAKKERSFVPSELCNGMLPDTRRSPRHPYHPSTRDFRRRARFFEASRALWELPVTTGKPYPRHDTVHLNLALPPFWIERIVDDAVRDSLPVLVSVARSGDLASDEGRRNFEANVAMLAWRRDLDDCAFVTPGRAVEMFAAAQLPSRNAAHPAAGNADRRAE